VEGHAGHKCSKKLREPRAANLIMDSEPNRGRQIGGIGTAARTVIGVVLIAYGLVGGKVVTNHGHFQMGFSLLSVVVGLVAFPLLLLAWQWLRSRGGAGQLLATGSIPATLNIAVVIALFLTPWYAPPLAFTSGAVMIFVGASMLLAAIRGYGGCELLAVSNWALRRDDQLGCLVLSPIDAAERSLRSGRRG
jgi:hypothetical protein